MSEQTYTESAINDRIRDYLLSRKDQVAIIQHLGSSGRGVFIFNPQDAPQEIQDIFLQYVDDFKLILKRTLTELVAEWFDDKRSVSVANNVIIVITSSTEIKLNQWSSAYEGVPVAVKCQIIGSLNAETYTKSAEYFCVKCHHRDKFEGALPIVCENEKCTGRLFKVDPSTMKTGDIKTIIIQELMDEVKHGTPKMFPCTVKDDMVFDSYPGQRKIITGVFRSTPKKGSTRNTITIEAISMQNIDEETLKMPSDEKKKYFEEIASKPEYLKLLTDSYAPEIKFRELEKTGLIISRVGSKKKGRIRGNIHCLLNGAPGTSKSKLLEFMPLATQRCGFATGGMATGAGITVTMTTLPDKTKFPKGGIVVQSSGSLVALDELNQFPDEDIGKTYTCMESGKIPYNKGGFDQVFNADTTIVAGANPKNGYYEPSLGMVKNINLPAPMISRFDIIINVLPETEEIQSQQISDHTYMITNIGVDQYIQDNNLLTPEELLELFNYANSLTVKVTPEATKLIDDYVKTMMNLQKSGDQTEGTKQFDRRFIESVLRISESITKLHLQTTMTPEFAMMAIELMKRSLHTFGVKTDLGETTIPLDQVDEKDKEKAFDKTWVKMCKDVDSQFLPEYDFLKFLCDEYPKLFTSIEKAEKMFRNRHEKGDLLHQGGRFKMVK